MLFRSRSGPDGHAELLCACVHVHVATRRLLLPPRPEVCVSSQHAVPQRALECQAGLCAHVYLRCPAEILICHAELMHMGIVVVRISRLPRRADVRARVHMHVCTCHALRAVRQGCRLSPRAAPYAPVRVHCHAAALMATPSCCARVCTCTLPRGGRYCHPGLKYA